MPKIKKKLAKQPPSAKKARKTPGSGNPWAYKEYVKPINKDDEMSSDEILNLECRNHYRIRPSAHVTDEQSANDEVFHMFGEMLGQDVAFMQQWVRCFILTHCKFVNKVASKYISEHSLKLQEWAKDLNKGCKADVLALFLLCIADTHCFVHTRNEYWTTLAENPQFHTEYSQRCNLHLSYLGKGIYVQHEI